MGYSVGLGDHGVAAVENYAGLGADFLVGGWGVGVEGLREREDDVGVLDLDFRLRVDGWMGGWVDG